MKLKLLIPISIATVLILGTGSYFLVNILTSNYYELNSFEAESKLLIEGKAAFYKGDPVNLRIKLDETGRATIDWEYFEIKIRIHNQDYGLNGTASFNESFVSAISRSEYGKVIIISIGPVVNTTNGLFALNVGEYLIDFTEIFYNTKKATIESLILTPFYIINQPQEEQVYNSEFNEGTTGWEIEGDNERINVYTTSSTPLTGNSLIFYVNQTITGNESIAISQQVNLENTHCLAFNQSIVGSNVELRIVLFIDSEENEMNLTLNEHSSINQIIHFGYFEGEANFTVEIEFVNAESGTEVYLDNISILKYEHRVFVVMLNDNWEWHGDEKIRDNLNTTIIRASNFFEKDFGIRLIPVLELDWSPSSTRMAVVDELALAAAREKLNLEDDWDMVYGRSPNNHGFDHLATFSNQSSEHYGFAYHELNIALHFAQSEELGDYSWLAIVNDWAENIVQHEISHNFGALDRYRPEDSPSIMTKPLTEDQAIADFLTNTSWFQVNHWLKEDILLILKNKAMFD